MRLVFGLISLAVVSLLACSLPVRTERTWVDATTGSTKAQTTWLGLRRGRPVVRASALERWMGAHGGTPRPVWWKTSDVDYNLFGRWLARRCGATPPPIYFMPPPWIEEFVRGAHDDEIAAFARVMREGTKAQQEATILATLNRP